MPTIISNCNNIIISTTSSIASNPAAVANNYYGTSCAANNTYLVTGACGENNNKGAVYVSIYQYVFGTYDPNYIIRLPPPNGVVNGYFGCSCAISNNTIVIGAYGENSIANSIVNNSGAVYIYSVKNPLFINTQRISSPNPVSNGYFGCSCAISGSYLVIGAMGQNSTADSIANNAGVVYIFSFSNQIWGPARSLHSTSPVSNGYFGCSCAMTNIDIVIGAYGENSTSGGIANNAGAAYTSTLNNGLWSYSVTKLTNPTNLTANSYFGCSCDISNNTIIISTISTAFINNYNTTGAIYVNSYNKSAIFTSSINLSVNILIVGGGGIGGGDDINFLYGGGGGGGVVLSGKYNFTPGLTYNINVGAVNNPTSITDISGTTLFLAENGGKGGTINLSYGKYSFIQLSTNGGGNGGPLISTILSNNHLEITQIGVNKATYIPSSIGTASTGGNGGGYNYTYNGITYGKGGLGAGLTSVSSTIIPNTGTGGNANGGLGSSGIIMIYCDNSTINNTPLISINNLINAYNTLLTPINNIPLNTFTSTQNIATIMNNNIPFTKPIPMSTLNSLASLNYVFTNS